MTKTLVTSTFIEDAIYENFEVDINLKKATSTDPGDKVIVRGQSKYHDDFLLWSSERSHEHETFDPVWSVDALCMLDILPEEDITILMAEDPIEDDYDLLEDA